MRRSSTTSRAAEAEGIPAYKAADRLAEQRLGDAEWFSAVDVIP